MRHLCSGLCSCLICIVVVQFSDLVYLFPWFLICPHVFHVLIIRDVSRSTTLIFIPTAGLFAVGLLVKHDSLVNSSLTYSTVDLSSATSSWTFPDPTTSLTTYCRIIMKGKNAKSTSLNCCWLSSIYTE